MEPKIVVKFVNFDKSMKDTENIVVNKLFRFRETYLRDNKWYNVLNIKLFLLSRNFLPCNLMLFVIIKLY